MGADLYMIKKHPKTWGFERSERAVNDGYFRDPYNEESVLWEYELSWWEDVIPLCDKQRRLSVEKTKMLLEKLEERQGLFEENIKTESQEDQEDFREGACLLKRFLRDAIALDSPIEASV